MVRSILLYGAIALVVIAVAIIAISLPHYRAAVAAGRQVLDGGVLTSTARGPIEYAEAGNGKPVLVIHGAGGGYDQGLLLGRVFVGPGFRIIAPSRFGYLRGPIPDEATPAAQADLFAALLDSLGIDRVAVVAVSDGGPSALQFALRHPQRTAALVMISAKSMTPPPSPPLMEPAFEVIFRSDYVFWAITVAARPYLASLFGVSAEVQQRASGDAQRFAAELIASMNPIGPRLAGIVNDRATLSALPEDAFRLDTISVPTLAVHAEDDGLQPYVHGVNTATRIAGAVFLSYPRGGHILLLQHDEVRQKIGAFLGERAGIEATAR